jgi:acetyltransferase-like isoleucine patch superfamily enzyme
MTEIYHIFKGIPEHELEGVLDKSGFLTTKGQELLKRIGVETEAKVSVGMSTIQNLVNLYNEWKRPKAPLDPESEFIIGKFLGIPEDDVYLQEKLNVLTKSYRMGIKIGEGTRIGEEVSLGLGVSIGRYCEISDLCELCIFSTIHDRVSLGKAVFVGKDSDLEAGSRIMAKAVIAPRNIVKENSGITEGIVFDENRKYR